MSKGIGQNIPVSETNRAGAVKIGQNASDHMWVKILVSIGIGQNIPVSKGLEHWEYTCE